MLIYVFVRESKKIKIQSSYYILKHYSIFIITVFDLKRYLKCQEGFLKIKKTLLLFYCLLVLFIERQIKALKMFSPKT